jgi:hypothetical protein
LKGGLVEGEVERWRGEDEDGGDGRREKEVEGEKRERGWEDGGRRRCEGESEMVWLEVSEMVDVVMRHMGFQK